jgi:hypothetical protein
MTCTKRKWSGKPRESYWKTTVYAYQIDLGHGYLHGLLGAMNYKDAKKYLGSRAKIYRRDIDPDLYEQTIFNSQLRSAIFYGATTIQEAMEWINSQETKVIMTNYH